jgi:cell division protein FtsB
MGCPRGTGRLVKKAIKQALVNGPIEALVRRIVRETMEKAGIADQDMMTETIQTHIQQAQKIKQLEEEVKTPKDQVEAMGQSGAKRPLEDEPATPSKKRFCPSLRLSSK